MMEEAERPAETRRRADVLICLGLSAATLATRLPLRSHILHSGDSVNFALALQHYSLADNQPHPPGYLLYVGLARLLRPAFSDANSTLVAISLASAVAAAVVMYLAGRDIFGRRTGLVAALLLVFSPLTWFYGEVALTYELELPLALLMVWFIYRLLFYRRHALGGAVVLGLAAGLRQDVLLFLGIFWLAGTLRLGRRRMLAAWGVLAVTVLVWLAPQISLAGGLAEWRKLTEMQFSGSVTATSAFASGMDGLEYSARKLWDSVVWLYGAGFLFAVVAPGMLAWKAVSAARHRPVARGSRYADARGRRHADGYLLRLLLIAILPAPALLFFLLVHIGQPGYLMIAAGPLLLLGACGLAGFADGVAAIVRSAGRQRDSQAADFIQADGGSGDSRRLPLTAALATLVFLLLFVSFINSGLFLGATRLDRGFPTSDTTLAVKYGPYSAGGIRRIDREREEVLSTVERFDPADTLVVAGNPFDPYFGDSRWLMYYLQDYQLVTLRLDMRAGYFLSHERVNQTSVDGSDVTLTGPYRNMLLLSVPPQQVGVNAPESAGERQSVLVRLSADTSIVPIYQLAPTPSAVTIDSFTLKTS